MAPMNKLIKRITARAIYFASVGLLTIGVISPLALTGSANAATVSTRSIQMSTAAQGATGVTYTVTFTPSGTSVQSLVLDFCDSASTPIPGAACTTSAGVPDFTNATVSSTFMTSLTAGTKGLGQIKLTGTAASTASTAQTITLSNVTNPTSAAQTTCTGITGAGCTFYGRIYTFSGATYGTYSSASSIGNAVDTGGFALATSQSITITATVKESLTFCASKTQPSVGCTTGVTAPNLTLGHGTPTALDSTAVDSDTAHFGCSTNANGNVVVRIKGTVLTSPSSNTIAAVSAGGSAGPYSITAGTAAFGMRIGVTSGTDYSASGVTPTAKYSSATQYSWDTTSSTNNTNLGAGDQIATVTPVTDAWAKLNFAATAALTTPAGIYTASESLIATGTF